MASLPIPQGPRPWDRGVDEAVVAEARHRRPQMARAESGGTPMARLRIGKAMTDHMTDQAKNYRGVHAVLYALFDAQRARCRHHGRAGGLLRRAGLPRHPSSALRPVLKLGFDERPPWSRPWAGAGRAAAVSVTVAGNSVGRAGRRCRAADAGADS